MAKRNAKIREICVMPRTIGAGALGTKRGKVRDVLASHGIDFPSDRKLTKKEIALYVRLKRNHISGQQCQVCAKWHPIHARYCSDCGADLPIHRAYDIKKEKLPRSTEYV